MRNPDWTRDEWILGLNLYARLSTPDLRPDHPEVIALSDLLRSLPIHPERARDITFRNPTGVALELRAFLRLDPTYPRAGLPRVAKVGEQVWTEFGEDQALLCKTAEAVRAAYEKLGNIGHVPAGDDIAFSEGGVLERMHRVRERSGAAVTAKKRATLRKTGRLACEACGFDFAEAYGAVGEGFAECHHDVPLCCFPGRLTTRASDLRIVCANCHRVLHRGTRCLTVLELRDLLAARRDGIAAARPSSERNP